MARICLWGTSEFTENLLQEGMAGGDLLLEPVPTFTRAITMVSDGLTGCDLLVLQWTGEQDLEPLRRLVENACRPVLVVTPAESSEALIALLETGVNDAVPATLSPREIMSHVRSLLRRYASGLVAPPAQELAAGSLCLDRARHEVRVDGHALSLPPREFALLAELLTHAGEVCPRQELIMSVWGGAVPEKSRTLDVHLGRLRARLQESGAEDVAIITLPGVGYRLEAAP